MGIGSANISQYQGPNIVYQHGVPHIQGQESSRTVLGYCNVAGVSFGRPLDYGVTSLSEKDSSLFKELAGYHTFDSFERIRSDHRWSKFSLAAASNFEGSYPTDLVKSET